MLPSGQVMVPMGTPSPQGLQGGAGCWMWPLLWCLCVPPPTVRSLFPLLEESSVPRPPPVSAILLPKGQEETNQL